MAPLWMADLAAVASRAPSADNSQPWLFRSNGRELVIGHMARAQERSVFGAGSHATLLSVGAVAENIQVVLTANRLSAQWCWTSGLATGNPYGCVALQHTPSKLTIPAGPMLRHTNRLAFRRDVLPKELLGKFSQYQRGGSRVAILAEPQKKSRLIRLVRLCSEARFCHRQLHEWLMASLRFTEEDVARGDGLDIRTLGLPPGGKQFLRLISDWSRLKALNRLGAYKLLALTETGLLSRAPALVCIVGALDAGGIIDAGRLMCRVWIDLNLAGIAVHPYYVVTDQIVRLREGALAAGFEAKIAEVDKEGSQLLNLRPNEALHMILRVGYPKAEPVRSRRLPLEAVFVDSPRPA
jgi:nitroreductase